MYQYQNEPFQGGPDAAPLRLALVPLAMPRTVPRCSFVDLGAAQFTVCRRIVSDVDACYGCGRPFCEAHRSEQRMAPQDSEDLVTRLLCRDCIELSYGGLEQVRAWRLRLNTAR